MVILIIAALVLLASVAVIAVPLFLQPLEFHQDTAPEDNEYSPRDGLLEALSELELSFRTGKVSPEDYQTQKNSLQSEYIREVEPRRK